MARASADLSVQELAELVYSGQGFGVKVTELDFDKSPYQVAMEGGTEYPENGSVWFGPYASEEEAERDYERARVYYEERARRYAERYREGELGWRVELLPWPVPEHTFFSAYIAEQEARSRGVPVEAVDLREVFSEPIEVSAPGPSSRRSALAEDA